MIDTIIIKKKMTNNSDKFPSAGPKYIYVGFSKCRTKTIKQAFQQLNYTVADHNEHMLHHHDIWLKIIDKKSHLTQTKIIEILQKTYKNYDVLLAFPIYMFWKEIHAAFPEAKVIFYQREFDNWYVSAEKHVEQIYKVKGEYFPPDSLYLSYLYFFSPTIYKCELWNKKLGSINAQNSLSVKSLLFGKYNMMCQVMDQPKFLVERRHRMHAADILTNCPKDKLILLNDRSDSEDFTWKKFCQKVGIPTNRIPQDCDPNGFPHVNKSGSFVKDQFANVKSEFDMIYRRERRENVIKYLSYGFVMCGFYYFVSRSLKK